MIDIRSETNMKDIFKVHEIPLNHDLLRSLLNRNITLECSVSELRNYAVAFAMRRCLVYNKIIVSPALSFDDIDAHIIASLVCLYN